jgi:hypothetical protein
VGLRVLVCILSALRKPAGVPSTVSMLQMTVGLLRFISVYSSGRRGAYVAGAGLQLAQEPRHHARARDAGERARVCALDGATPRGADEALQPKRIHEGCGADPDVIATA